MKNLLAILAVAALIVSSCAYAHPRSTPKTNPSQNPSSPTLPVTPKPNSDPTLQTDSNSPNKEIDPKSVKVILPPKDKYDYVVLGTNLALALIGLSGIFVAVCTLIKLGKQTKATEDAVSVANLAHALAEKTAKQQLRAYLTLRQARLFLLEDGALRLKMEIEDSGQTPAYDVQGAFMSGFADYPRTRSWEPPQIGSPQSKAVVGSGRAFYMGGPIPFTQKDIEGLRNNSNRVLFMTARFTYLDIFKESHQLRLQLVIGGPMGVQLDTDELGKKFYMCSDDVEGNEGD